MKDQELMRNGSGYYDETAYKALTAAPKPGEVYLNSETGRHYLVLQNRGEVCSTLLLSKEKKEHSIEVPARVPMYTDPIMIGYTFHKVLGSYVKTIPDENFKAVLNAVAGTMGFDMTAKNPEKAETDHPPLDERIKALEDERTGLLKNADEMRVKIKKAEKDYSELRLKFELEYSAHQRARVYKDMYEHLLDRLIAAKATE